MDLTTAGPAKNYFGYVPYNLLENLDNFLPGDLTTHGYYVDSSPRVADVWIDNNANGTKESSEWRTVLISGLRKGGYGYFALDVTDPPSGTGIGTAPRIIPSRCGSTRIRARRRDLVRAVHREGEGDGRNDGAGPVGGDLRGRGGHVGGRSLPSLCWTSPRGAP